MTQDLLAIYNDYITSGNEDTGIYSSDFSNYLDKNDELHYMKEKFLLPNPPVSHSESKTIYLCGNSLGLQPFNVSVYVNDQLNKWATQGVEGHFTEPNQWLTIDDIIVESMAKVVGGLPKEVILMNSLTANLHFMLAAFYRPTVLRHKIVIEGKAFPSDIHAVVSQIIHHNLDPKESLIEINPKEGQVILEEDDIESLLLSEGDSIALVLLSGVQYYTGQFFDIERITKIAKSKGCVVGWDLAHAAGNVELSLHDWDVDFACWCTYKYLNSGPGSIGGCFVHEKHCLGIVDDVVTPPRLAGWWGHRVQDRFLMDGKFIPSTDVKGFRVSNTNPLLIACARASLDLFDEAGMSRLRKKSILLTGYLEYLLMQELCNEVKIFTPNESHRRGCQLSLTFIMDLDQVMDLLKHNGVICDERKPNVIRIAPTPLYNSFSDVFEFVRILKSILVK